MTDPWREVDEWKGKHANSAVPEKVQERVCRRFKDICQGPCHQKLGGRLNVHMDHIVPLRDWTDSGHGNRESNLQPLCHLCHRVKTGLEARARAQTVRIRKRHLGIKKRSALAEKWAWAKRLKAERQRNED